MPAASLPSLPWLLVRSLLSLAEKQNHADCFYSMQSQASKWPHWSDSVLPTPAQVCQVLAEIENLHTATQEAGACLSARRAARCARTSCRWGPSSKRRAAARAPSAACAWGPTTRSCSPPPPTARCSCSTCATATPRAALGRGKDGHLQHCGTYLVVLESSWGSWRALIVCRAVQEHTQQRR